VGLEDQVRQLEEENSGLAARDEALAAQNESPDFKS
jgi:hypothetical protein